MSDEYYGYYISFHPTGEEAADRMLRAVANAGKAFHATESWNDEARPWRTGVRGANPVEWIQNAATDAASELSSIRETLAAYDKALKDAETLVRQHEYVGLYCGQEKNKHFLDCMADEIAALRAKASGQQ